MLAARLQLVVGLSGTSFTSGAAGMDAWKLCNLANGALALSPGSAALPVVALSSQVRRSL